MVDSIIADEVYFASIAKRFTQKSQDRNYVAQEKHKECNKAQLTDFFRVTQE